MRFAYIDSNGNEVPIPSVDALALRIELGAISDDTQLYDAQADQWAPATSHEIYHTLSRSSGDDEGFVAPPPVAPIPLADPDEDELVLPSAQQSAEDALKGAEATGETTASVGDAFADIVPTDAPPPAAPVEETPEELVSSGDVDDLGFDTLELAPALDPLQEDGAAIDLAPPTEDPIAGDDDGVPGQPFDFGDMDPTENPLTLESDPDEAVMDFSAGMDSAPMDFSSDPDDGGLGFAPDFEEGPTPDFSGGMELDSPMEFSSAGFDSGASDSLELETPMSEFSPDAPPAWMDGPPEAAGSDQDVMDFSSVSTDAITSDLGVGDASEARSRPPRPKIRRRKNLAGPLILVVFLVAGGVGAYAAWPAIQEFMENRGAPPEPTVVIPPLAEGLIPAFEQATDRAFAALLTEARQASGPQLSAPPAMEGAYMANASAYASAEDFWASMSETLDVFRSMDIAAFDAAVVDALGTNIQAEDADAIRARASAGFVAASSSREAAFDRADALFDAGVRFHQFLVANEANIEHAPAASVTTDPITEVVPASAEVGTALNELMDAVLGGLAGIQYRDVPNADGIWARVLEVVQEQGVQ